MNKVIILIIIGIIFLAGIIGGVYWYLSEQKHEEGLPDSDILEALTKGINLGWDLLLYLGESKPLESIQEKDFELISKLGFTHVRLPIGSSLVEMGEEGLSDLDQAIDWCEKYNLTCIIDLHKAVTLGWHRTGDWPTDDDTLQDFADIWYTLAQRYQERSQLTVIYELFNEPWHRLDVEVWHKFAEEAIKAIRKVDQIHSIIVAGPFWGLESWWDFKPVSDPNVIYTFHFYHPPQFTHQGSPWISAPHRNFRHVPYPADPNQRQEVIEASEPLTNFEISVLDQYLNSGIDREDLEELLQPMIEFAKNYKVPLYCGEFGVRVDPSLLGPSLPEDRARWHGDIRSLLEKHNIGWAKWSYGGRMGLVTVEEDGTRKIDESVLSVLGLTPKPF